MRRLFVYPAVLLLASLSGTSANTAGLPNPAHPWERDQALLETIKKEVGSQGIRSVQSHMTELESAIASAKLTYIIGEDRGLVSYTLVDGPEEAIVATMMATTDVSGKVVETVSVANPYPAISFYLGSYYNEVGRAADALRVLDKGLSLSALSGADMGEHRPTLIAEKGAALSTLKRWQDALADYDEGLTTAGLDASVKALM